MEKSFVPGQVIPINEKQGGSPLLDHTLKGGKVLPCGGRRGLWGKKNHLISVSYKETKRKKTRKKGIIYIK